MLGRALGVLLVFSGLAFNKWTLEAFVILDGSIGSTKALAAIALVQLALVGAGTWLLVKAPRLASPTALQLGALFISCALAVLMGEVCLHVLGIGQVPDRSRPANAVKRKSVNYVEDSNTGWRMRGDWEYQLTVDGRVTTYRSNSQGFRGENDFDPGHDALIALVGDSFTWGFGVDQEETFGSLLEERLPGSMVCNLAMQGFGIDQMWMSVRHNALPLDPELVIVAFIDEDFERSLPTHGWSVELEEPHFVLDSGTLRKRTPEDEPGWLVQMLRSHSRIWGLAEGALEATRPFGTYWSLNTAMLDAIATDCRQQGVPLLVVRLPQKRDVPESFEPLADFLHSRDIQYLDLASANVPAGIHFQEDSHINPTGHQYVMEAVARWIDEHLPQWAGPAAAATGSTATEPR